MTKLTKKEKMTNSALRRCRSIPKKSKFVFYKNPNEARRLWLEKINPDHIGILWGQRKANKQTSIIRIAKVYLSGVTILLQGFSERLLYLLDYCFVQCFNSLSNLGLVVTVWYILIAVCFIFTVYNIPLLETLIIGGVNKWTC